MPVATERQIAWCSASLLVMPQLPSFLPLPVRLMLATRVFQPAALAGTQHMPHRICESVPVAFEFRTFTDTIRVPGATPATTEPVSRAAMIPATLVPWPLSSFAVVELVDTQFLPDATFRSAFAVSTPVSSTATEVVAGPCASVSDAAPIRRTPGG